LAYFWPFLPKFLYFFMNFMRNLRKMISPTNSRNKMLKKSGIEDISKQYLFRSLTYREKMSTDLYDYRDISECKPNNKIIITCEHASNE